MEYGREIFKWNKLSDKFSNHNITHEKKRFQNIKLNVSLKDYDIDFSVQGYIFGNSKDLYHIKSKCFLKIYIPNNLF